MNAQNNESDLLRRALLANCVFSGLSGIIFIFGSNPLSGLFGLYMPTILIGIGALLLVYATALLLNALRVTICQTEAFLAVSLNIAWVVGSIGLMFAGSLSGRQLDGHANSQCRPALRGISALCYSPAASRRGCV